MVGAQRGGMMSSIDPHLMLNPPKITWELPALKGTCPPGRSGHTTTEGFLDGELLLFGGGGEGTYFNDLWRFNCEGFEWGEVKVEGNEPEPRAYHTAVHVGQRLFIFGGWKGDEFINDLSVLEAREEGRDFRFCWTPAAATGVPPGPRAYHTAVELHGKVVIFGGWGAQDFCADVAVLRVVKGEQPAWETSSISGQSPKARAAHTCTRIGDLLYVFGGESTEGRLNDVAILDMSTRQWTFPKCGGTPPSARSGHGAAAVGRWLIVYGGWDGDQHLVDMHLLDTVGMRWVSARSPVPKDASVSNVLEGRSGYSSALINSDKLLVTGGWDRENFLADVVVLDLAELTRAEWGGGLNNGFTMKNSFSPEKRLPLGSPVWLENIVATMTPHDRLYVEHLPEWQTFISQAPKIVQSVEHLKKEETIDFMKNMASLFTRIAQKHAGIDNKERGTQLAYSTSDTDMSVKLFGSTLALQAASTFSSDVKHWEQPYAATLSIDSTLTMTNDRIDAEITNASLVKTKKRIHDKTVQIIQGCIKERALLGGASLLNMLLKRELVTSRLQMEKISTLAREVNVQPLFKAYGELKGIQEAIRAHKVSHDAQELAKKMVAQEHLHQRCSKLAAVLTTRLRDLVHSQRRRYDHVRSVSVDIKEALDSCQFSTSSRGETSGLPEFLMEGDAFADIEEALTKWEAWETEYALAGSAFSATDEALVALNDALMHELTTMKSMKSSAVVKGREKARDVVRAATRFVGYISTDVLDSEVQQTESLLADCNSLATELSTIAENRKKAQEVQVELKNVLAAHLKASEAVIRNHAELELLRLHGTSDSGSNDVETKLSSAKKSVADLAERQSALEATLAGFAQSNMPELLFSADLKLAKRLLHTGLVVDRRLSDYEQLEVLHGARHHVLLVKLNNRLSVLKEIALNNDAARKVFENEVGLLWRLDHPAIIKVDAVFYEGLRAYIQMPFIDQGTLGQWLASNPKPWEVQSVFRQLVQGLAFMHDNGVVHRDIKMDNILMTADTRPVICDFGISHEEYGTASTGSTRDERTTGGGGYAPAGTEGYIAPEVLCGKRATPAADMWALGILLCKAYLGCEPVVTVDSVAVPERFPGEPVQDLVEGCLRINPDERLTANEALANPFFSVQSLVTGKQVLETEQKIGLLRRQVRLLRPSSAQFALHLRRATLIRDTIEAFNSMDSATLMHPFHVHFIGEPAIGSGLLSDFYESFFSCLARHEMFEGGLPRTGCEDFDSLRVVGILLGRCIIDRCSVSFGATSLFKFLLNIPCSLSDLEMYDSSLAIGLRNLLLGPLGGGTLDDLFFEDGTRVCDANKREFVQQKVQHVLVNSRLRPLLALKSGFDQALGGLEEALSVFSATDMQLLMCGENHIDGHMVASRMRFAGWPSYSSTPGHLISLLHEMTPQELRRFLLLGTSACALDGDMRITIHRCPPSERLPVGRTCFRRIDLPDYSDKEMLRKKLLIALSYLDEAFTLL